MTLTLLLTLAALLPVQDPARPGAMDVATAETTRFEGAVGVWYGSHFEDTAIHDWDPIREWNGPFHPLLGEYKTDDREVVRKHLAWLRRAGVDVLFYDACRIDPAASLSQLGEQRTLKVLCEELAHQEHESRKLRLAVWLEKWNDNPSPEAYRDALAYTQRELAGRDFYFRLDGKPLVLTYYNGDAPELAAVAHDYADAFTLRRIASSAGAQQWEYLGPAGNAECMTVNPGADGFMEMAFITQHVHGQPIDVEALRRHAPAVIRQRAGGQLFQSQLLEARQVDPQVIFISGWNDWAYCLQIEPAEEYGFLYVDLTARLLGRFDETRPYR